MAPYVTCRGCEGSYYATRGPLRAAECPACGLRLGDEPRAASPAQVIDGSLVLLREMMDMDVALLTQITGDREVVRHCAGEWPGAGDLSGAEVPVEDTFCKRLLAGEIENIVPDVAAEPAVRELAYPRRLGVRSYIGVPIRGSHSRLYVLCCLAREAHPELGARDVRVLEGFVRSLLDQLELPPRASRSSVG